MLAGDSTSNANNATTGTLPTQTSGQIGKGQSFDGTSQSIGIPDAASLDIPTDGTFSVWFKLDELRQSDFFEKGGFGGSAYRTEPPSDLELTILRDEVDPQRLDHQRGPW